MTRKKQFNHLSSNARSALTAALSRQGLRSTRQRELVFGVLLQHRDHPSAEEVYQRSRSAMPSISLATVYNCLEMFVRSGLVRAVNYERTSTRYCPNLHEHAHFQDRESGKVFDVNLPYELLEKLRNQLPDGFDAEAMELIFIGKVRDPEHAASPTDLYND